MYNSPCRAIPHYKIWIEKTCVTLKESISQLSLIFSNVGFNFHTSIISRWSWKINFKFWISYQPLAFLSILSHWQLIQNSAQSTIVWCQCDIRIVSWYQPQPSNHYILLTARPPSLIGSCECNISWNLRRGTTIQMQLQNYLAPIVHSNNRHC